MNDGMETKGKMKTLTKVAIVYTIVATITVVLAGIVFLGTQSISPEIFIHTDQEVTLDLTVRIEDGVTKTIPEVDMGREAVWKDLTVRPDGIIEFEGDRYPFLYYEGVFIDRYPDSDQGWAISPRWRRPMR